MRNGFGCEAVGDTRVDLASGQSKMAQAEYESVHTAIMPHSVD